MFGTDIGLKHQVAMLRHNEFLAEAKLQQEIADAFGENRLPRRGSLSEARAAIATLLLRAGSWLMPEDTGSAQGYRGANGMELRPSR